MVKSVVINSFFNRLSLIPLFECFCLYCCPWKCITHSQWQTGKLIIQHLLHFLEKGGKVSIIHFLKYILQYASSISHLPKFPFIIFNLYKEKFEFCLLKILPCTMVYLIFEEKCLDIFLLQFCGMKMKTKPKGQRPHFLISFYCLSLSSAFHTEWGGSFSVLSGLIQSDKNTLITDLFSIVDDDECVHHPSVYGNTR